MVHIEHSPVRSRRRILEKVVKWMLGGRIMFLRKVFPSWPSCFWRVAVAGPFFAAMLSGQALARCDCEFDKRPYEAFGTKAACTIYMLKSKTSCNVEFGGLGTDMKVARAILGLDPNIYKKQVYDVLVTYLQLLRDEKTSDLVDPKFLATALLYMMRGAYVRSGNDGERIAVFDRTLRDFLEKYSGEISAVFSGTKGEMSIEFNNAKFLVGKGHIIVEGADGAVLITEYLPAGQ
jgi:hypothetical protein